MILFYSAGRVQQILANFSGVFFFHIQKLEVQYKQILKYLKSYPNPLRYLQPEVHTCYSYINWYIKNKNKPISEFSQKLRQIQEEWIFSQKLKILKK